MNGTDIHPDSGGTARIAQPVASVGISHKALPSIIGAQGIAASGAKIETGVKFIAGQVVVGTGLAGLFKQGIGVKRTGTGDNQNVLAQDIERTAAACLAVEAVTFHCAQRNQALNHFKPVGRHQQRFRRGIIAVIGSPDTLDQPFDIFWGPDLDY